MKISTNAKNRIFLGTAVVFCAPLFWCPYSHVQAQESSLDEIVVHSTGLGRTLTDQAQPVTVLSGRELDMKSQGQIGDTLASEPGISSSSFGPGAGRPVIRGFDGERIRVLENGVGSMDLSSVSPDHAVTIQSALVDKIEVVRGPATLLYGTSAVGGVVNIFDNRIPETMPSKPVEGTVEVKGQSVDLGRSALMSVNAPVGDSVAVHMDGFASKSDDYDIPGYARTAELRETTPLEYPEPKGKLTYSQTQTDVLSGGGSYIGERGYLGASYQDYKTIYGVPNGEPDVSINAHRRRVDVRGGVKDTGEFIDSAVLKTGVVDYDHTEFEGDEAGSKFRQNAIDTRLDMQHQRWGDLSGTWGLEFQDNDFKAIGEEAFQPPTESATYSLFLLEEYQLLKSFKVQAGGRYDWNSVSTTGFDNIPGDDIARDFDSFSQSLGGVWDMVNDYSLALSVSHTERAPNGQELFADGVHVATGIYEVGDPDLEMERSLGTDLTLRKAEGEFRGSLGGFYNRFWDYINPTPTGEIVDDYPEWIFQNINADFWGFESQVSWHPVDTISREVSFDLQPDYVWARDRDNHDYLARIPPLRIKVGANYFDERYVRARLEVQQVFAQDKTAPNETTTDGYTMLNAYVSKDVSIGKQPVELFLRGTNLLSEKARNNVSFIKDVAPLPGASAMAGFRVNF